MAGASHTYGTTSSGLGPRILSIVSGPQAKLNESVLWRGFESVTANKDLAKRLFASIKCTPLENVVSAIFQLKQHHTIDTFSFHFSLFDALLFLISGLFPMVAIAYIPFLPDCRKLFAQVSGICSLQ